MQTRASSTHSHAYGREIRTSGWYEVRQTLLSELVMVGSSGTRTRNVQSQHRKLSGGRGRRFLMRAARPLCEAFARAQGQLGLSGEAHTIAYSLIPLLVVHSGGSVILADRSKSPLIGRQSSAQSNESWRLLPLQKMHNLRLLS